MAEQKRRGRPKKQVEEPIVKNEEKKMRNLQTLY